MDFKGYCIAAARRNAQMTMDEAAKRLGISKNTLFLWEHDEDRVPIYAVNAIADLYQVPKDSLACSHRTPEVCGKEA